MSANINSQRNFGSPDVYGQYLKKLLQIILIILFYFAESGGGGKKGAKKKGSSFQTVSALFRVQYILEFQRIAYVKKLNYHNCTRTFKEIYDEAEKSTQALKKI